MENEKLRKIQVFGSRKNTLEQNKEVMDSIQQEIKDCCKWIDILRDASRVNPLRTEGWIQKMNEPFLHLWNLTDDKFKICSEILNKRKKNIESFVFFQEAKY